MSLRSFIIISLLVHLVGGLALYFYYNPIHLPSAQVERVEEETKEESSISDEESFLEKKDTKPKPQKKSKARISKKSSKKNDSPPSSFHPLSEPESPLSSSNPKPFLETKDSPDLTPSPSSSNTGAETKESLSKSGEEKVSPPPVKTAEASLENSVPQNPEDYEIVETPDTAEKPTEERVKPEAQPVASASKNTEDKDNSGSPIIAFNRLKQKLGNPSLSYPDFARREGMEGVVSVLFVVTKEGLVDQILLESSSGHSQLDNFVITQLSRYEFLTDNLEEETTQVRHKVHFKLEGKEEESLRLRQEETQ